MSSPEQVAQTPMRAGAARSWSATFVALWLCWLALAVPYSAGAQTSPPASEREVERRRLLDQVGLKKRTAVAPSAKDAEAKEKANEDREKTEKDESAGNGPAAANNASAVSAPPAIVFVGRVHAALLGACGSCHTKAGRAGRSAYVLDGNVQADFAAAQRYVDVAEPERSPLLRLASGTGHAGGVILSPSSAERRLLLRWISDGAKQGPAAPAAAGAGNLGNAPAEVEAQPIAPAAATMPGLAPSPAPPSPPEMAPSGAVPATPLAYAPTVHEALNRACSGCHRSGALASRSDFILSGEVASDFASARRFVDLERPDTSRLLIKASGVAHAGGPVYPPGSAGYLLLQRWLQSGASGTSAAAATPAPETATAIEAAPPPALARQVSAETAPGAGLRLPFDFRLNGRFDLNYERRNFDTQPFSAGDNAIQSYHHFLFLSRQTEDDPVGFSAEILNLSFWEVRYRLSLPESVGQLWIKAGKLLVPFGPEPLFHKSYGGLAGFDQRVLPVIWAEEGLSATFSREQGDFSGSADLYAVRGYELRQRDGVLNLQSDFSALDSVQLAVGARLRASWKVLSLFYSGYGNGLGFGRVLYLQALDLAVWRLRGVPVLQSLAADLGLLRADVSGAGPGQDYYHFASYFRLRYFFSDWLYAQYRQGLRTFDNRRGVFVDDTRLTRDDGSTHNFGLVAHRGSLTFGLYYFFNLEKADEVDDDFLRVTALYEF